MLCLTLYALFLYAVWILVGLLQALTFFAVLQSQPPDKFLSTGTGSQTEEGQRL